MALVYDDVFEMLEQFRMVLDTANSSEGYS